MRSAWPAALAAWLIAGLLAGAGFARQGDSALLRHGGFEQSVPREGLPGGWLTVFPMNVPSRPSFGRDRAVRHSGAASGRIVCPVKFGYVSWTQSVGVPAGTRTAIFSGFLRTDLSEGFASLLLLALDAKGRQLSMTPLQSACLAGRADWRRRGLHLAIPQNTARLIVRAGVHGKGTAWFDDLALTCRAELVPPAEGLLVYAEIEGAYAAWPTADAAEPSVTLSVPGPFEGQMPVEYGVGSVPDGKIGSWAVLPRGDNRFLQIKLQGLKRGQRAGLRWRARLLLRERPGMFGLGAKPIRLAEKTPQNVREFLQPAKGVEVDGAEVKAAAAALQIADPKDFRSVIAALSALLAKRVKFAGGENQGAAHSLRAGKAVCTGLANAACAVLRARGIPTRILANVMAGSSAQEHYITESCVPEYGWVRYESTQKAFPVPDTSHIVLRVIRPTDARSPFNVPLYLECSKGMAASTHLVLGPGGCWHRSKILGSASIPNARADRAYAALGKFWAAREGQPCRQKSVSAATEIQDVLREIVPQGGPAR